MPIRSPENTNVSQLRDYDLFKILDVLYEVNDYGNTNKSGHDSRMAEAYIWRNLGNATDDTVVMDIITPDYTNMSYHKTLQCRYSSFRYYWIPWILGQGGNDWSCIKLAEAYSRMLSKRKVMASLVVGESSNERLDSAVSCHPDIKGRNMSYISNAWNGFLDKFGEAQKSGMLAGMYNVVNNVDKNLVLFSKTGTPDQYANRYSPTTDGEKQYMDVAYYCFGLMSNESYNNVKDGKQPNGLVCVLRITRKLVNKDRGDGLWSTDVRNFFSQNQRRFKKFYDMTKVYY